MMYITTKQRSYGWHVNEKRPDINIQDIISLQADSDELDRIVYHFPMLVPHHLRVVVFPAPFANLIFANIFRLDEIS